MNEKNKISLSDYLFNKIDDFYLEHPIIFNLIIYLIIYPLGILIGILAGNTIANWLLGIIN